MHIQSTSLCPAPSPHEKCLLGNLRWPYVCFFFFSVFVGDVVHVTEYVCVCPRVRQLETSATYTAALCTSSFGTSSSSTCHPVLAIISRLCRPPKLNHSVTPLLQLLRSSHCHTSGCDWHTTTQGSSSSGGGGRGRQIKTKQAKNWNSFHAEATVCQSSWFRLQSCYLNVFDNNNNYMSVFLQWKSLKLAQYCKDVVLICPFSLSSINVLTGNWVLHQFQGSL